MTAVEKYNARVEKINSLVCVGLDTAEFPQFEFNRRIIDQTAKFAAAYKLNIAFYESHGEAGLAELKKTMDYLRATYPEIFTICDAKRGDIGHTNEKYAKAIFDYLGFDAVTLHPYLGREALEPFLNRADKAAIILCKTSNLGGGELQDLQISGNPLWRVLAEKVFKDWNTNGNCMLVVGGTYPKELAEIRKIVGDMTLLVPGIGVQGGDVRAVCEAGLNSQKYGLIINSSRGIIFADDPGAAARKLRDEINEYR